MKIFSADDDVTAYEVCNDFGIILCGDEGRAEVWQLGRGTRIQQGTAFCGPHTKKGRTFSGLIGSLLRSDTLSGHRNVAPRGEAIASQITSS